MDYKKIGNFIADERKSKKLTQAKLAEKLFVSEKTVSKWENGKSLPDTSILNKLCEILDLSINELLSGERIQSKDYVNKAEERLLQLKSEKDRANKMLLATEIIIAILGMLVLFLTIAIATLFNLEGWKGILIIISGAICCLAALFVCLKIEQRAGYYICKNCSHKYTPSFSQILWAPHVNRSRYMKCPNCKKHSWHKKVVN